MLSGSQILAQILGKTGDARESILLNLLTVQRNVPDSQLKFVPVHAYGKSDKGEDVVIEYLVSPDYLSGGTDMDYLRIPLMPRTAQKVADFYGCILPTKKMVDQIYEAAAVKLSPQPISPNIGDPGRDDSRTYGKINQMIQAQIGTRNVIGLLMDGHKKNVIITSQLLRNPKKVAIYGWHQRNGLPIQPVYLGHGDFYVDYSHGIRLVSKQCRVNGVQMDLEDVLKSKAYAPILTGEGPMSVTRYSV